jgi:hypothetical protein
MWPWFIAGYALFSAALAWRATGVAIHCDDAQQRKDAFKVLTLVWGGGTAGAGVLGRRGEAPRVRLAAVTRTNTARGRRPDRPV